MGVILIMIEMRRAVQYEETGNALKWVSLSRTSQFSHLNSLNSPSPKGNGKHSIQDILSPLV